MDETEANRYLVQIQQEYIEFLGDDRTGDGTYLTKVKALIQEAGTRLMVNINDLRKKNFDRCVRLLENGFEEMPLFQKALREVIATIDTDYAKETEEFFIGLEGSFGSKHVTPRSLTSLFLGNTVCVEGIVTKCSLIRPKIVRSVHYCPTTSLRTERRYADISSFDVMPSVNIYPTKDDEGNLLETEYGLSRYRDHQTITIQEMPEKAPTGQLPRSLDIILDNDLVDICKPGDRVLIVGVFRCLPAKHGGFTSGVFKAILLATNITLMHKDPNLRILREEQAEVKRFSKTMNPFRTLARSLAPSIHGHEFIKKAVLSLLLGGREKILPNGTRLRGDINVLLIGDPSVAKSQMLRYVSNVAPRVVMTTGRGSSGVGLTAAVTTDMETGERRLEAGAMVLADRGIVCIDEFDKMSDADRTAIHEVMEQGRVTIAKAGIHARLNARTSVLAAANPVYGRYDEYKSPMDNIGLQDSLLSRFDLLFIVLDTAEPEQDRLIADHVLRMHRYRNPTEQDGEATSLFQNDMTLSTQDPNEEATQVKQAPTYEKHDPLLHGRFRNRNDKILSMDFMKKYIHIAKCIEPNMTSEASKEIAEAYTRLRSMNLEDATMARTQPITARSLETLIRLATAQARARMSKFVSKKDAEEAIILLEFAIFKRVLEKEKKRKVRTEDGSEPESEDEAMEEDRPGSASDGEEGENGDRRSSKRLRRETADDPYEAIPSDDEGSEPAPLRGEKAQEPDTEADASMELEPAVPRIISNERYNDFKSRFSALFEMEREESLTQIKIVEWLTAEKQNFTETEVLGGLDRLHDEGKIMVADGIVFLM